MAISRRRFRLAFWRGVSIFFDLAIAYLAFYGSYVIVYDSLEVGHVPGLEEKSLAFAAICGCMIFVFGVHRSTWRYVSLPDTLNLVKTVVATVAFYTVGAFLMSRGQNVPRSVIVLSTLLLIAGLVTPRLIYRLAVEGHLLNPIGGRRPGPGMRAVIVLGLTHLAENFIRNTRRNRKPEFFIAGILDSAEASRPGAVQGIRIMGSLNDIKSATEKLARQGIEVQELVIAEQSPSRRRLSEILRAATAAGLKTTRIPDVLETSSITDSALIDPKPIELRDLLGRPEVQLDTQGIAGLIAGRTVLATGAGGSIGSELTRQIAQFGPKRLIISDNSEFNTYMLDKEIRENFPELDFVSRLVSVRDRRRLNDLFASYQPDVVFHAAALKHVPLVQDNPIEGIKTNVLGTRNVVDVAMKHGVSTFVMISTDKAVNPTNVMGATKRAAEAYCQMMDVSSETTRFKTVRFGNVLGSNGSVVPRFQEQIAAGGPVTVTHPNIVRYFMTIPEAVRLVLHASAHALEQHTERGKIMVLDMGDPVRIADLAERMIQLAGFNANEDIDIVYTGLRPGEKLYEELFDPSEVQNARTKEGFVIASPRMIDRAFLLSTLARLEQAVEKEDPERAVELLRHIVPEYRQSPDATDDADKVRHIQLQAL